MFKRPTPASAKMLTPAVQAFVGEFLQEAQREDPNSIQDYMEMLELSPVIGPAIELKILLGLTLFDEYNNPTPEHEAHIRKAFELMRGSLKLSVAELLVVEPLGFACSHWAPGQIKGKWLLESIRGLDPRRYSFRGKLGEITDLLHEGTPSPIEIPYSRVIHLVNQPWLAFGNPYGVATCRRAIAYYKGWKIAIASLVIAAKRRGEPILMGYADNEDVIVGEADDGSPILVPGGEALIRSLQDLENGSVAVTSLKNRVEPIEAADGALILAAAKELERLQLQAFLVPETMLRATGTGDSNLNSGQRELLNLVVGSRIDQIKEALIEQVVRPLLEWEFGEDLPSYGSFPVPAAREENANELLNTLINAVYNGAFSASDLDVINRMRELAQLPPVEAIAKLEGPAIPTAEEAIAADPVDPVAEEPPATFGAAIAADPKEEVINITLNLNGQPVEIEEVAENGIARFRAAPAAKAKAKKTSKGQKKKNCSKGTWCIKAGSTGSGTCINAKKVCQNNNPSPAAKKQYKTGKPKSNSKGGGGAAQVDSSLPTLQATAYNQYAIADLTTDQFREFRFERERLQIQDDPNAEWNSGRKLTKVELSSALNRGIVVGPDSIGNTKLSKKDAALLSKNEAELAIRRDLVEKVQLAIDEPLITDQEAANYKPTMTAKEALDYTKGTYTGGLKFYHGNQKQITDDIAGDGAKPELNNAGIFGKGFYMAASKSEAENYAAFASSSGRSGEVGVVTTQVRVKNPYVANASDLDKIGQWFPGGQSTGVDSQAITEFIRAKGHDSIYLKDYGFFVALDGRQVVSVANEDYTKKAPSILKRINDDIANQTNDQVIKRAASSETGKVLAQAAPTQDKIGDPPDEFDI